MKDVAGIERSYCNVNCSCSEYLLPQNGNDCDYCGHKPTVHQKEQLKEKCKFPGCSKDVYEGSEFCSIKHRNSYSNSKPAKICKLPNCNTPAYEGYDYCGKAHAKEAYLNSSPCKNPSGINIIPIPSSDPKFKDIENQFSSKWLHSANKPQIEVLMSINYPQKHSTLCKYEAYCDQIIKQGGYIVYGHGAKGNVQRRFHGTNITCNLGIAGNSLHCTSSNCSICGIVTKGFLLSKLGTGSSQHVPGFSRFGSGIYFSATSSKSHDYSHKSETALGKSKRCMLLCNVVVGRGYKLQKSDKTIYAPPNGYHSVLGETGVDLNYDEVVIYNEDAAIPTHFIIYSF